MNRYHPYFAKQDSIPIPDMQQDSISFSPYVYEPRVANTHRPIWIDDNTCIGMLAHAFDKSVYSRNNGYNVDTEGNIVRANNPAKGGVISAMAVASTDCGKSCDSTLINIINTENAGLRYISCDKDGYKDLGPVENVCFIGNLNRAEGVYIPFCNTKAIADGAIIVENMLKEFTKDDKDLVLESGDQIIIVPNTNGPDANGECNLSFCDRHDGDCHCKCTGVFDDGEICNHKCCCNNK